ncbi:MAG TPA: aminotransferase class V-fold PLP-dependent enzyme [Blastocatellia bacterium]|nr:aminotransferase class V-fold PLP-dependent enzyme [Blastocatellia bacterium]
MSINRRRFLTTTGLSLAAGALSTPISSSSAVIASEVADALQDWSAVRDQFELSRHYIHLSSFFLASHPRPVREAIEKHRQAIENNPFLYLERRFFEMPGRVRAAAAEYLGGKPEEVALTNSTTMGLAFVYHGLPVKAGQEVLTTTHDHYVHHEAIRLAAERAGATVKKIALFDDFNSISEEDIVRRIIKAVTPKTRAVGITWVHSSSGLKVPLRRIAEALAEINAGRDEADRALLIVDGVHGLGVEDETVAQMGCDFFIAGTHKWIFGPRGTGIIWAKADTWKMMRPTFPAADFGPFTAWLRGETPGGMAAAWIAPGGFHAFEYAWALPEAFAFHRRIGRARVAERIHSLNDQCKEGLARMRHVKLYTPRGKRLSAGIICFDVEGMKPEEVVARLLARRVIASTSPYAVSCVRLAPSLLNSPEEIETTLLEIRALGASD